MYFLIYGIITIVSFCLYYHSLNYGYSNNDDDIIIKNNIAFLKDASNLPKVLFLDAWFGLKEIQLYRPLQGISFILDAQWGNNILYQIHLTSLFLHILCCICVFHLLLLLRFRIKIATLGAFVYAVHYLFLHTVIWVPARGDLLLAIFSFLSFITFIKLSETGEKKYFIHIVFFGLALLSKETAVLLPIIFVAYLYLFAPKKIFTATNSLLFICYVIIYLIFSSLRRLSTLEEANALGLESFIKNLPTLPETIAKIFIPINFSTMPSFHFSATLAGILIIIGGGIFFMFKKNLFDKMAVFSLFWFLILILPGMAYRSGFSFYTYEYLDHRCYIFCFGILLLLLNIIGIYHFDKNKYYWFVMVPILLYLAVANLYFSRSYENAFTYSSQAIKSNPNSALAYFINANEIYTNGDTTGSIYKFSKALEINPKYYEARYNRAYIYSNQKKYTASLDDLNILLAANPNYEFGQGYSLRGVVKAKMNDIYGACADFELALKLNPTNQTMKKNLESCSANRTIQGSGGNENSKAKEYNNSGVAAAKNGMFSEAIKYFNKALEETPQYYDAISNLGTCKHALKDIEGACSDWRKAAEYGDPYAIQMLSKYCK